MYNVYTVRKLCLNIDHSHFFHISKTRLEIMALGLWQWHKWSLLAVVRLEGIDIKQEMKILHLHSP